jgi:FkbM family methyltransferase
VKLKYLFGQALAWTFRFGELRLVHWLFKNGDLPETVDRRLFGGIMKLDLHRSSMQQLLFLTGERTVLERHLVRRLLKPGMRIVDVGANIGYYLLMFREALGDSGYVVCIEPSPENLRELRWNIESNQIKNVSVHECAVGRQRAQMGLRDGINSGVVPLSEGVFTTSVVPLDEIVGTQGCDFLKIDVEGYEWEVLNGSQIVLERFRPTLFLEFHPDLVVRQGGSMAKVMELLNRYYTRIEFFEIPDHATLGRKIAIRYLGADPTQRFSPSLLPENRLSQDRLHGTFWIVCHPDGPSLSQNA